MFDLGMQELFVNKNYNQEAAFALSGKEHKYKVGNNYNVFKKKSNKIEIGMEYKNSSRNPIYKSVTFQEDVLMKSKYVYNENVEKEINRIQWYEENENVVSSLEMLYEETKYPGVLYALG